MGKEKEEGETKESMSPQDKVERVLKEIHVTFSRSEMMDGHPDKVIIDRKKFLGLLDRLNQGIYDMMDQYEQTRQSRNNAERAFRKKGDEIIEAANANAEDVYAASVIYTADMIGAIRDLMDQTNDSMNDLFMQFKKDLREQKDKLQSHCRDSLQTWQIRRNTCLLLMISIVSGHGKTAIWRQKKRLVYSMPEI